MEKPSYHDSLGIIERIYYLHGRLIANNYPNIKDLKDKFEVSDSTAKRTIEFMKDRLNAPIEYDRNKKGYYYTSQYSLPQKSLKTAELILILIGQSILARMTGSPFEEESKRLMEKLPYILGEEFDIQMGRFGRDVSIGMPQIRGDRERNKENFELLSEAIETSRIVSMEYLTAGTGKINSREFSPYHLRLQDGAWYVIGHCHLRNEMRIFAVDRIKKLELTENYFKRPSDFTIEKFIGNCWGIEHDKNGKTYRVVVEFSEEQSRYIRERVWHKTQILNEIDGKKVRVEFLVDGLKEIKRWILSYGGDAKVLEPPELVEQIRNEAEKILLNLKGN